MSLASSTSSLISLQILTKLATFIPNQLIVRWAPAQIYGTAAIQFELLLSTILFLSREGVRNASLRNNSKDDKRQTQAQKNVAVLPFLAGTPITIFVSALYFYNSTAARQQPYFTASVALISFAALLELATEPYFIRSNVNLQLNVRVKAEGVAIVIKSIAQLTIMMFSKDIGLLAFALGQLGYSLSLMIVYLAEYRDTSTLMVKRTDSKGTSLNPIFDSSTTKLSLAMTQQSLIKHALTEGDKLLVSRISTLEGQGAYALGANYGSMVARIIFQPIEESSRIYFSRTLAPVLSVPILSDMTGVHFPTWPLVQSLQSLSTLLLLSSHLSLFLLTFGPPFLPLLLSFTLPKQYHGTSAPGILHAYIYYLSVMSFNGILEAFVASISTPDDLARQSKWMILFSAGTVVSGYLLAVVFRIGDQGLVWANAINSLVRAGYCISVARDWFREKFALARRSSKAVHDTIDTTSSVLGGLKSGTSSGNEGLASVTGLNLGKLTKPIREPLQKPMEDALKAGGDQIKSSTEFSKNLFWTDIFPPKPVLMAFAGTAVGVRTFKWLIDYEPGLGFGKDLQFVFIGAVGFAGCCGAILNWEKDIIKKADYYLRKKEDGKEQ